MSRSICYFRKITRLTMEEISKVSRKSKKRIYKATSRGDVKIAYNEVAEAVEVVCCSQVFSCQTGNSGQ